MTGPDVNANPEAPPAPPAPADDRIAPRKPDGNADAPPATSEESCEGLSSNHSLSLEARCRLLTQPEPQPHVLQDYVPFDECLDWSLSRRYWEIEGSQSFRSGEVPFIVNNDGRLSEDAATLLLAQLDAAREAGSRPRTVRVLELGAGSGLFAKLFLDALQRMCRAQDRDDYGRTTYFVTDGSPVILEHLESSGLLSEHSDHIVFAHVEALEPGKRLDELLSPSPPPDASIDSPPDAPAAPPPEASGGDGFHAVFTNYLLDNLPCKILHLDGDRTHELMVQTVLDERVTNRCFGTLSIEKVRSLQDDDSPEAQRELVSLYPTFLTNTRYDRIERAALPRPDDLPSVQATTARSRLHLHNYGALQCLDEVIPRLAPHGFILIADYGHDAHQPPSEVLEFQHFGGSIAIGINFGQLDDVYSRRADVEILAPSKGWAHQLSRMIARHPPEVEPPAIAPPVVGLFKELFDATRLDSLAQLITEARTHIENHQLEAARWKFKEALQAQPGNWSLHEEIAGFLVYDLAQYDSARDLAHHGLTINPLSTALWNILGDAQFHLEQLDEAVRAYLQALKLNERDTRSQLNVANMFIVQGDYEGALRLIAEALCFDMKCEYRETLINKQNEALQKMATRQEEDLKRILNRFRGHRDLPTRK